MDIATTTAPIESAYHPSATSKVLGIFELLENILLHLPLRDLLVFNGVSTFLNDTSKHSTKIQQALFLEPHPAFTNGAAGGQTRRVRMPINPFLDDFLLYDNQMVYESEDSSRKFLQTHVGLHTFHTDPTFASSDQASWRRMMLIQPKVGPIAVLHERYDGRRTGSTENTYSHLRMEDLLTLNEKYGIRGEKSYALWRRFLCDGQAFGDSGRFLSYRPYCAVNKEVEWVKLGKVKEVCGWDVLGMVF